MEKIYQSPTPEQPPVIRRRLFKGDPWLWTIAVLLLLMSVIVVYSSTGSMVYRVDSGDTSVYLIKQVYFAVISFLMMWICHVIPANFVLKWAKGFFGLSMVLLFWAYINPYELNDATRSLNLGGLFTIQPADAVKVSLIFVLAAQLSHRQSYIQKLILLPPLAFWRWKEQPNRVRRIINTTSVPLLLPVALSCAVILYSNLSTSLVLFVAVLFLFWLSGVKGYQVWRLLAIAVVAVLLAILVMRICGVGRAETWVNRLTRFGNSVTMVDSTRVNNVDDDFQLLQAKIAIASGGFNGKGPGNSTQRSQLPHPYSDFAYAFITEEYGIWGAIFVPILYLLMMIRARKIAYESESNGHRFLVLGLMLVMVCTAFLHILVSVGLAPVTGQVLPFISLGGSAMAFNGISLGLVLSVSRETNRNRARAYIEQQRVAQQMRLEEADENFENNIDDER